MKDSFKMNTTASLGLFPKLPGQKYKSVDMKLSSTIIVLLLATTLSAQSKIEKLKTKALKEGFLLYESEKASWHGSDLFLEKFTDRSKIGGYVSYTDGDNPICIFVSKDTLPKVLGTMTFDKTFNLENALTDLTERDLTAIEKEYLELRNKAKARISTDTIFKYYKNTNYNIVPVISDKERKVYVITASTANGVVIFGNDYLISFDKKNKVSKTERLHKGMLTFKYGDDENQVVAPMHSHLPEYDEIMTPTDICTTLLYQDLAGWESNYIMSDKYVSIWSCKKNELFIMTIKAWKKIAEQTKN